ncbi:uncharacterized protein LOC128261263 [Drosophila gunungcola]|uniref:uncharacterized protein LOC128261263 n=1 Tax=Drosophila gunungcola TaxID=103775 RepID=UPI0022E0F328|nr:uncharacterized protein LOC128261263 [Drosophila gunungcola]
MALSAKQKSQNKRFTDNTPLTTIAHGDNAVLLNCRQFYFSTMPNRPKRKKDRCNLVQYILAFSLCLLFLPIPVDGMRCRIPYERVRENYCYFVADEEPLHTSFHNFCYQDKRTSRVCLDSDEEMRFLAQHLYEMGYPNGTQFWSAGHRWPGDNRFYWNYFGRARPLVYTNWAPDEPTPEMGRNCLILTLQGGELMMSSESCYKRAVDICEQTLNGTDSLSIMH